MKKIISLLLTLIMVFSLATVAAAESYDENGNVVTNTPAGPTYNDVKTITFEKWFNNPNNGVSPAETFTFTWEKVGVTNGGVVNGDVVDTVDEMPDLISISSAEFAEGDAGKVVINNGASYLCKRDVTITLDDYNAVGIYEYKIKEVCPEIPTTGIVYHPEWIKLVVTVVEQDGKIRVAAVHTESNGDKDDKIINVYESGSLAVSKTVTGNLGDKDKEFNVTVTFIAPDKDGIKSTISYVEDGETKTIAPSAWGDDNTASVVIRLKDGETITFTNIPASVKYTVVEDNYTSEGYDEADYEFSDVFNKLVDKDVDGENEDTCMITNNKSADVDTGISLDSAPYFLMLAVAVFGMVALVSKKRYEF